MIRHRPEGKEDRVIYTGTHDNEVTRAWFETIDENERRRICEYLNSTGEHIHRDLIELAMRSPARMAVFPMQDVLGKGRRMNTPGTTRGNWDWRVSEDMLTAEVSGWLRDMAEQSGRVL